MPSTALVLATLSAAAFLLAGCIVVNVDRGGGYYRTPPPAYQGGDGYYNGGSYRCW